MLLPAFIFATLFWAALALYLSHRQVVHVLRHRDAVPEDFAASVSLEQHRRAADYTIARERLARVDTLVDTAASLGWALGGIGLLYAGVAELVPPSVWRGVAFLIAAFAVGAVIGLPVQAYRVFALEERFGFNHTTLLTFVLDRLQSGVIGLVIAIPLLYLALWVMSAFEGSWWVVDLAGACRPDGCGTHRLRSADCASLQPVHPARR